MDPLVKKQLEEQHYYTCSVGAFVAALIGAGISAIAKKKGGDAKTKNDNAVRQQQYELDKWKYQTDLYQGDKRRGVTTGMLTGLLEHYGLGDMFGGGEGGGLDDETGGDALGLGLSSAVMDMVRGSGNEDALEKLLGNRGKAKPRGRTRKPGGSSIFDEYLDRSDRPSYPGYKPLKSPGWGSAIWGGLSDAYNSPAPPLGPSSSGVSSGEVSAWRKLNPGELEG